MELIYPILQFQPGEFSRSGILKDRNDCSLGYFGFSYYLVGGKALKVELNGLHLRFKWNRSHPFLLVWSDGSGIRSKLLSYHLVVIS